jgi:hypothetical protein
LSYCLGLEDSFALVDASADRLVLPPDIVCLPGEHSPSVCALAHAHSPPSSTNQLGCSHSSSTSSPKGTLSHSLTLTNPHSASLTHSHRSSLTHSLPQQQANMDGTPGQPMFNFGAKGGSFHGEESCAVLTESRHMLRPKVEITQGTEVEDRTAQVIKGGNLWLCFFLLVFCTPFLFPVCVCVCVCVCVWVCFSLLITSLPPSLSPSSLPPSLSPSSLLPPSLPSLLSFPVIPLHCRCCQSHFWQRSSRTGRQR